MKKNKKMFLSKKNTMPYNYIWTKEKPLSYITEAYQKFLANLEYVNVDKKYKTIQITSSLSGEGKSTFLANVAYLLSQKNKKTILIDLDLRKPKVHRIYDIENSNGITDLLAERTTLDKAIKKNKHQGFDIIPSGERTTTVINLIESQKMNQLILSLREKYDYILIDSPPVINVSDALYISKFADAVVFAISQSQTKKSVAKEAVKLLRQNNVNVIGTVITQIDLKSRRYGYGYGYGYGYYNDYTKDD